MRTFILLCVVAFAIASPIDDKKSSVPSSSAANPDISKLPLKKDEVQHKPLTSSDGSVVAHPLNKRDNQNNPAYSAAPAPATGVKAPQGVQGQQPLLNNQRPVTTPNVQPQRNNQAQNNNNNNNNNQRRPSNVGSNNSQKTPSKPILATDPIPPRPVASNSQPILSQNSRVRRDAPKPTDQKSSQSLPAQKSPVAQQPNQKPQSVNAPAVNSQKKSPVPASPAQGARITRDAPKPTDQKTPAQASVQGQKSQVAPQPNKPAVATPAVNTPKKAPVPVSPVHASRTRRDAPKVTDQKTSAPAATQQKSPVPQQSNQKPAATSGNWQKKTPVPQQPNQKPAAAPVNSQKTSVPASPAQGVRTRRDAPKLADQKTSAPAATQQKSPVPQQSNQKPAATPVNSQKKNPVPASPAQATRVNRDAPKPVDAKTPQTGLNQKSPSQVNAQKPQAQPSPAQIAKGPSSNSRVRRDAPNPHEQSKIVPSAYQPSQKASDSDSHPAVDAKKDQSPPSTTPKAHKRDSQTSNNRDSAPSSYQDNQSPSFVHPVPVDHILKKPAVDGKQSVTGVTYTDNTKIEPSFPTSEKKPASVHDQKSPVIDTHH